MRRKKLFTRLFLRYRRMLRQRRYDLAQKVLDEMKASHPSSAWYHQGLLLSTRAFHKKTGTKTLRQEIACFKKSLEHNPRYDAAWRSLGICYLLQRQYAKAESAFKNSFACARNDIIRGDALRYLSTTALQQGKLKKSLALLNRILKLKKRPPYLQLASHFIAYYRKTKNKNKIIEWARKGIMSARIVEKSGKQAYFGDKNEYQNMIREFQSIISALH